MLWFAPISSTMDHHPRAQPHWLLTHNVVRRRLETVCFSEGISTVSTCRPSCRWINSFCVPQAATTCFVMCAFGSTAPEFSSIADVFSVIHPASKDSLSLPFNICIGDGREPLATPLRERTATASSNGFWPCLNMSHIILRSDRHVSNARDSTCTRYVARPHPTAAASQSMGRTEHVQSRREAQQGEIVGG